jgi:hypothetical protein
MSTTTNARGLQRFRWWRRAALSGALALTAMSLTGCNDAQAGLLLGSGLGALTGQAIGHDTCSTLLGLGIGATTGYIIGNESDKAHDRAYYDYYGSPPGNGGCCPGNRCRMYYDY